ncbi:hypothetical protein Tsedi_00617 [Tepidimonas sediminis]|uniref:Uncharacterized protein n=1 Tax=Tepidimonas sediminis TaxID=2588941 RepID=A0A554WTK8_9BURK|nr:hypothetical protein [Tepidimonas sediminis]TSE26907.1 hypothetical protein Tsedi_00617 [Tepidimonas sediminis]
MTAQIQKENPTVAVGLPAEVGGAADVFDCSAPHRRPEDAGDPLLAALLRAAWCLGRIEAALDSLADELRAIDVAAREGA